MNKNLLPANPQETDSLRRELLLFSKTPCQFDEAKVTEPAFAIRAGIDRDSDGVYWILERRFTVGPSGSLTSPTLTIEHNPAE